MYLLDTNHCSKVVSQNPAVIKKLVSLGETPVGTSVITQGELLYGAHQSQSSEQNLAIIRSFLSDIEILEVDQEVAEIYGKLKSDLLDHFGPRKKDKRKRRAFIHLSFSENDLWIAAVAKRHEFIMVTKDTDFARIRNVLDISCESWY